MFCLLTLLSLALHQLLFSNAEAEPIREMNVRKNHSEIINTKRGIETIAIGNPAIADALLITPQKLLLNGLKSGATSLTIILDNGSVERFQILVTQDLTMLREYLYSIDTNIQLTGDPNGNAVILMGTVANDTVIKRALEATIRFLGTSEMSVSTRNIQGPTTRTYRRTQDGVGFDDEIISEDGSISNEGSGQSSVIEYTQHSREIPKGFSETIKSGNTRVINLLVSAQTLEPGGVRLQRLLDTVDSRITVEEVNNVYYLNGNVKTPSALIRALTLANTFAGYTQPNYEVISDQGGVLMRTTGNNSRRGSSRADTSIERYTQISSNKRRVPVRGNIRQNIARGDVISVAQGQVISLIRVDVVPRVEVKMRVVAIDRAKTDELGVNWEIANNRFALGNYTGGLATADDINGTAVEIPAGNNLGFSTSIGSMSIGAVIKALETRGAARTLSEPLLTVLSGETANYLIGGEVPITTGSQTISGTNNNINTTTTILYRDFGILLNMRPTVLDNGKIAISLDQEITDTDFSSNVFVAGNPVPGFTNRSIQTFTEAGDGETWAVAGLLSYEDRKNVQAVPWISKVPVLGELFKVSTKNKSREELVITVTARTVNNIGEYDNAGQFPESPKRQSREDLIDPNFDFAGSKLLPSSEGGNGVTTSFFDRMDGAVHSSDTSAHAPDQKEEEGSSFWEAFGSTKDNPASSNSKVGPRRHFP